MLKTPDTIGLNKKILNELLIIPNKGINFENISQYFIDARYRMNYLEKEIEEAQTIYLEKISAKIKLCQNGLARVKGWQVKTEKEWLRLSRMMKNRVLDLFKN